MDLRVQPLVVDELIARLVRLDEGQLEARVGRAEDQLAAQPHHRKTPPRDQAQADRLTQPVDGVEGPQHPPAEAVGPHQREHEGARADHQGEAQEEQVLQDPKAALQPEQDREDRQRPGHEHDGHARHGAGSAPTLLRAAQ